MDLRTDFVSNSSDFSWICIPNSYQTVRISMDLCTEIVSIWISMGLRTELVSNSSDFHGFAYRMRIIKIRWNYVCLRVS